MLSAFHTNTVGSTLRARGLNSLQQFFGDLLARRVAVPRGHFSAREKDACCGLVAANSYMNVSGGD